MLILSTMILLAVVYYSMSFENLSNPGGCVCVTTELIIGVLLVVLSGADKQNVNRLRNV